MDVFETPPPPSGHNDFYPELAACLLGQFENLLYKEQNSMNYVIINIIGLLIKSIRAIEPDTF